jgi:hypothetical protein
MKKFMSFFLVLSLLSVSGNLFAQNESSFKENFLLSTQSEIYAIFLGPRTSLTASSSFYIEKKTHPTQNLAYHIPGTHLFLGRTHPFGNTTSEMLERYGGEIYNYKYGFQEEQRSEVTSPSLAEGYLKRLAERKKKSRKNWGAVGLWGGGICLGLGAAVWAAAEKKGGWESWGTGLAGAMLVATGAVGVVVGALSLAIPSGAERELEDVLRISDLAQRERASHEALSSLAARGKKSRIISCIVLAGFSAYFLSSKERNYEPAGFWGALAVSSLIRKTPEERAFQNYQKDREQQKKLGFHLGIGPHGGVKVGLSLSY